MKIGHIFLSDDYLLCLGNFIFGEVNMVVKRKNETELYLYEYIKQNKVFSKAWEPKKLTKNKNKYIQSILDKSSKQKTGNRGEPDLLYCNDSKKLLILLENKDSVKDHISLKGKENVARYAMDGIRHYLSFFMNENLSDKNKHLNDWKIVGIAFSGDINDEYNKRLDTFFIKNDKIENAEVQEILNEEDYISLFENIDIEKITSEIAKSSQVINNKLRIIDSQKRPVLLSALMIALFDKGENDFKENYRNYTANTIIVNIPNTIEQILTNEGISKDKIDILLNEVSFLKTQKDLKNTETLKEILDELKDNVIPLFSRKSNYDIIGKFYEEFLKYAGVSNVKKGIVLTPHHITTLFTDLIPIKTDDVIFDPCCGTGAFLIAGMNKIHRIIDDSSYRKKESKKNNVKERQLLGFELNTTMYSLAISNMLFRGDGKSRIFNEDFFGKKALKIMKDAHPTIGLMNPPYSGKNNKNNPTKKEIQFLERMLDGVSRYGIMIAPLSTYFKDEDDRNRILTKHTLKCVINMPKDLFQPNAMTHTAISIFETNIPHDNKDVIFYDLKEDGFVLSKNKGRTDRLNKWREVRKKMIDDLQNVDKNADNLKLLKKSIGEDEEWLIQAHCDTDYSNLSSLNFEKSIKEYTIFETKQSLGLLDKDIDDITMLEILNTNGISSKNVLKGSS